MKYLNYFLFYSIFFLLQSCGGREVPVNPNQHTVHRTDGTSYIRTNPNSTTKDNINVPFNSKKTIIFLIVIIGIIYFFKKNNDSSISKPLNNDNEFDFEKVDIDDCSINNEDLFNKNINKTSINDNQSSIDTEQLKHKAEYKKSDLKIQTKDEISPEFFSINDLKSIISNGINDLDSFFAKKGYYKNFKHELFTEYAFNKKTENGNHTYYCELHKNSNFKISSDLKHISKYIHELKPYECKSYILNMINHDDNCFVYDLDGKYIEINVSTEEDLLTLSYKSEKNILINKM